jgi:hypothetical protein
VDDRGRIAVSMGIGALMGGVAGYLLFTERGRVLRNDLEPRLNELAGEIHRLRLTFDQTRAAVAEGWQSVNQLMKEPPSTGAGPRWGHDASRHQPH